MSTSSRPRRRRATACASRAPGPARPARSSRASARASRARRRRSTSGRRALDDEEDDDYDEEEEEDDDDENDRGSANRFEGKPEHKIYDVLFEEGSDATEVMNHPALAKKGVGLSVADKLAVTRAALGHFPDETGSLAAPSARQWCCGFCINGPKFFSFHTLADLKEVKKHMRNHNPGLGAVLDGTVTFRGDAGPG